RPARGALGLYAPPRALAGGMGKISQRTARDAVDAGSLDGLHEGLARRQAAPPTILHRRLDFRVGGHRGGAPRRPFRRRGTRTGEPRPRRSGVMPDERGNLPPLTSPRSRSEGLPTSARRALRELPDRRATAPTERHGARRSRNNRFPRG